MIKPEEDSLCKALSYTYHKARLVIENHYYDLFVALRQTPQGVKVLNKMILNTYTPLVHELERSIRDACVDVR